jgi:hypothetical protein
LSRYEYRIDGREVDLSPAIPIPASSLDIPVWLARQAWMLKTAWHQVLPAVWESSIRKAR